MRITLKQCKAQYKTIHMLDEKALGIIKKMMEAFGPSGFEREVNSMVKAYMEPIADEVLTDKLGTVAFSLKGEGPTVLLAGHTDEVGFIVSSIAKEGYLTFNTLGGWWSPRMIGLPVVIGSSKGDIPGVIATKSPFHMEEKE